jgi:hypothetical protein
MGYKYKYSYFLSLDKIVRDPFDVFLFVLDFVNVVCKLL